MIHLGAWRARGEHNKPQPEDLAGTLPTADVRKLGLAPDVLLKELPPLSELCEGMEAMLG